MLGKRKQWTSNPSAYLLCNSLTTTGYIYWKSLLGCGYLFLLRIFLQCLELALETWVKALLIHSMWVHDLSHTHSLASFQWSNAPSYWKLPTGPEVVPLQGERTVVSTPICANKMRNGSEIADWGCLTASQGSCCMSWLCLPTFPYPTFSKPMLKMSFVLTDNVIKVRWRQKASLVLEAVCTLFEEKGSCLGGLVKCMTDHELVSPFPVYSK